MADQTISVSLDTSQFQAGAQQAEKSTDELRKRIGELLREAMALKAGLAGGTVQDKEYADSKARIGRELSEVQRQLRSATQAAKDNAAATTQAARAAKDMGDAAQLSGDKTTQGSGRSAQALINITRAGQDFAQSGLGAVANNIEQLIPSFQELAEAGFSAFMGPAGIVAGLTALTVVGPPLWEQFTKIINGGVEEFVGHAERVAKVIKDFEENPPKNLAERAQQREAQREAGEAERAPEVLQGLGELTTSAESTSGQGLRKALTDLVGGGEGYQELIGELKASIVRELVSKDANLSGDIQERDRLRALAKQKLDSDNDTVRNEGLRLSEQASNLTTNINRRQVSTEQAAETEVSNLFTEAFKGSSEGIQALAERLKQLGRSDLANEIQKYASSYSIAVQQSMDEAFKRQKEANEAQAKYQREVDDFMTENWKYVQEQRAALRKNSLEIQAFMDEMHGAVLRARQAVKGFAAGDEAKKQKEFDLGVKQLGGQGAVEAMLMQAQQAGMGQARGNRLAEAEVARMARMPKQMGGLGYGREEAAEFAEQAVRRANESLESRGWRNVNVEGRLAGRQMDLMERMRSGRSRPASRAAKTRKALRARGKVARKAPNVPFGAGLIGDLNQAHDPDKVAKIRKQMQAMQGAYLFDRDAAEARDASLARANTMIEGQGARSAMFTGVLQVPSLAGMLGGVAAGAGADRNIASVVSGLKSVADALTEANRKGVPIKLR